MNPTLERNTPSLYEKARAAEKAELKEEVLAELMTELKPLRDLVVLQVGLLGSKDVMRILKIDRKKLQSLKDILKPQREGVKDLYNPEAVLKYIHQHMGKRTPGRNAGREARKRLFAINQNSPERSKAA